jgi:hypothetical protein
LVAGLVFFWELRFGFIACQEILTKNSQFSQETFTKTHLSQNNLNIVGVWEVPI